MHQIKTHFYSVQLALLSIFSKLNDTLCEKCLSKYLREFDRDWYYNKDLFYNIEKQVLSTELNYFHLPKNNRLFNRTRQTKTTIYIFFLTSFWNHHTPPNKNKKLSCINVIVNHLSTFSTRANKLQSLHIFQGCFVIPKRKTSLLPTSCTHKKGFFFYYCYTNLLIIDFCPFYENGSTN